MGKKKANGFSGMSGVVTCISGRSGISGCSGTPGTSGFTGTSGNCGWGDFCSTNTPSRVNLDNAREFERLYGLDAMDELKKEIANFIDNHSYRGKSNQAEEKKEEIKTLEPVFETVVSTVVDLEFVLKWTSNPPYTNDNPIVFYGSTENKIIKESITIPIPLRKENMSAIVERVENAKFIHKEKHPWAYHFIEESRTIIEMRRGYPVVIRTQ